MDDTFNDISSLTLTQLDNFIEHFFREKKVQKKSGNSTITPDWVFQSKIPEYTFRNIRNEDFGITHDFRGDPNKGWKIHLNVEIENIARVSKYLKDNHFYHKFLSGGLIEDGKTFTVYIGSYSLVHIIAKRLSFELANYLLSSCADTDILLENNIAGRFEYKGEGE